MSRGDRRGEILQAAERLFTSRRFHEVTLDMVAQAAKVGKGTIYRYFTNKEDLVYQLISSGLSELCLILRDRVPRQGPFPERLLLACGEVVKFYDRRRQLFRLMQNEDARLAGCHGERPANWQAQRQELVRALAQVLDQGVAEGALRADLPTEIQAQFLLGMLRTRARELTEAAPDLRRIEWVVELFCHGVAKSAGAVHLAEARA